MLKLQQLLQSSQELSTWAEDSEKAFSELFGSDSGRYPSSAKKKVQFRTPQFHASSSVPFSAIIHESNPANGGYGGMSFVIFPVEESKLGSKDSYPMIAMVTGTQGLSPDDHILGKAGHSRKMNAICKWLNADFGNGEMIAWAKKDAVRIDKDVPDLVKKQFPEYADIFSKYGKEIYGFCKATPVVVKTALKVFLDFHFDERGIMPLTSFIDEFHGFQYKYFNFLMPSISKETVKSLLLAKRFVVLQGPPGTGKTRMADDILRDDFGGQGFTIQFHPNTTYENFIGGLSPDTNASDVGLRFRAKRGNLLEAVALASNGINTLLVIDEINRADLAKVLGEAIYCFEPGANRAIDLPFEFGPPIGRELCIPSNLYVLGTMNTADRSIAIMDVAIRRRFAFLDLWPQMAVVQEHGDEVLQLAYKELLTLFVEYASDDAFALMPGHSYFIKNPALDSAQQLKTNLIPLLEEYLIQGYVSNFSDELFYYIQSIASQPNGKKEEA